MVVLVGDMTGFLVDRILVFVSWRSGLLCCIEFWQSLNECLLARLVGLSSGAMVRYLGERKAERGFAAAMSVDCSTYIQNSYL